MDECKPLPASTPCRSLRERAMYAVATAFIASSASPWCFSPPAQHGRSTPDRAALNDAF